MPSVTKYKMAVALLPVFMMIFGSQLTRCADPPKQNPQGKRPVDAKAARLANLKAAALASLSTPRLNSHVQTGASSYLVLNLEFKGPDECNQFSVPGAYILWRYKKFADVMVPENDSKLLDAVLSAKGACLGRDFWGGSSPSSPPSTRDG